MHWFREYLVFYINGSLVWLAWWIIKPFSVTVSNCYTANYVCTCIVSVFSNSECNVDWKLKWTNVADGRFQTPHFSAWMRTCQSLVTPTHWISVHWSVQSCTNPSRGLSHPYLEFFCCCFLFCDRDTQTQLEFKSSPALGASDSVSQTFKRPASYINIRQECPNDIHRAIIYFPVISLWHKLDLIRGGGENRICLINCIITEIHRGDTFGLRYSDIKHVQLFWVDAKASEMFDLAIFLLTFGFL